MQISKADDREYRAAHDGVVYCTLERGVAEATGADRIDFLNRMTTGEVSSLKEGEDAPTVVTNEKGRIVDVLRVVELGNRTLLICLSESSDQVTDWLEKYTIMDDFETRAANDTYSVLLLTGRGLNKVLDATLGAQIPSRGVVVSGEDDGTEWHMLREDGLVDPEAVLVVIRRTGLDTLKARLEDAGATAISHETYQLLRIRAGRPAYGMELTDQYNPLEAGLSSSVSFTKGCFIGQEVIARLDTYDKVKRHLFGVRIPSDVDPNAFDGNEIRVRDDMDTDTIGSVTSLGRLPDGTIVGLAYIRTAHGNAGDSVFLDVEGEESRGERTEAQLTHLPIETE